MNYKNNNLYEIDKSILYDGISMGERTIIKNTPNSINNQNSTVMNTTEQNVQQNVQADQQPTSLTQEQAQLLIKEANRVQAEREALKGKNAEQVIEFYLDYMQSKDKELGEKYPLNNLSKTIKDCYNYILDKVRKECGSSAAMVQHTTVFEYARQYFVDDTIQKFKGAASGKAVAGKTATQSKEDKIKAYNDWETAHKDRVEAWENSNRAEIEKWNKQHENELFFDPNDNPYLKKVNPYTHETNPNPKPENIDIEESNKEDIKNEGIEEENEEINE